MDWRCICRDLRDNPLLGSIPSELMDRSKNGSLSIRYYIFVVGLKNFELFQTSFTSFGLFSCYFSVSPSLLCLRRQRFLWQMQHVLPIIKHLQRSGNMLFKEINVSDYYYNLKSWYCHLLYGRVGGNMDFCASSSCQKKKKSYVITIVAIVSSLFVLLAAAAVWIILWRKRG